MCPSQHAAHFERIRVWKEAQVHAIQEKTEGRDRKVHLTICIYSLVLESQLPHIIVNLLCTMTENDIKLAVLWWS
jgi:hypothetical protein